MEQAGVVSIASGVGRRATGPRVELVDRNDDKDDEDRPDRDDQDVPPGRVSSIRRPRVHQLTDRAGRTDPTGRTNRTDRTDRDERYDWSGRRRSDERVVVLRPVPSPPLVPTKLCTDGHANNPDSRRCGTCEQPFPSAAEIVEVPEAVVARLMLDDGVAVDLVGDLVVGRNPTDDRGRDTMTVSGRQVSRCHLILEVDGWEMRVRDCDSTNGTFLIRRGERGRRRIPQDRGATVRVGDTIHFGERHALALAAR